MVDAFQLKSVCPNTRREIRPANAEWWIEEEEDEEERTQANYVSIDFTKPRRLPFHDVRIVVADAPRCPQQLGGSWSKTRGDGKPGLYLPVTEPTTRNGMN